MLRSLRAMVVMRMPRMRRKLSSLSYYLGRAAKQLKTARTPRTLLTIAALALAIFLFGGGIYDILEKPIALIPVREQRILFYHPYSLHEQFVAESLEAMALYAIGVVGLILAYKSTKYSRKPRQAFILLATAILFIALSYLGCSYIMGLKLRGRG